MELSELVQFRHLLLAFCDITGLVWKVRLSDGAVFQRYALADGDGNQPKPFKTEWATVRDGVIWVGSIGRPWVVDGQILHRNAEWVKSIDEAGHIQNHHWKSVYAAIRHAVGVQEPGYVWMEAVHWDEQTRTWLFLPRKVSHIPYDEITDERQGSNIAILASDDLSSMRTFTVGPLEPEWGFTSVRKVPGTSDVYLATKAKEVGGVVGAKLVVFNTAGDILWEDAADFQHIADDKYEGLAFLT